MAEGSTSIPVSTGTIRLSTVETAGFRLTDGRFPRGARLGRHHHERACLTVVVEGAFSERLLGRWHDCGRAMVLAKPAGEPHDDVFSRDGSRQLIVEPTPGRAAEGVAGGLFDRITCVRAEVLTLARLALEEMRTPDALSPLALESLALELSVVAGRAGTHRPEARPPGWLLRVRDRLHDGFDERLTVAELAVQAGVHRAHLAREFRRFFGVSPAEYRRAVQLEWAAARLRASDEPIAAIALRAGFFDQSHLTRGFRRRYRVTPGQYRSRHSAS